MNYSEIAFGRCVSYARHSGKTLDQMAKEADVDVSAIKRLKAGKMVTYTNLTRFERAIPKEWRNPLPAESDAA